VGTSASSRAVPQRNVTGGDKQRLRSHELQLILEGIDTRERCVASSVFRYPWRGPMGYHDTPWKPLFLLRFSHFSGRAAARRERRLTPARSPPSASSSWFQRQAVRPEVRASRLIDNPDQLGLEALLGDAAAHRTGRPQPKRSTTPAGSQGAGRGLRSPTKAALRRRGPPVEVIDPAGRRSCKALTPEQYEVIDHKVTRRLAQRPGSYVVLEYRRPVVRHKATAP